MEYNTTRDIMPITEYGRHVKKMIEYAITIEDRAKRSRMAKTIVMVMSQVNMQPSRENAEYKHKLWDNLFQLSDYHLDIDAPYPVPERIEIDHKPEKISYPTYNIMYKHYGNNIERIIKKAIEQEEGPAKKALVITIANHMKKSYLNWNRDAVTDEVIASNLEVLSGGKLKLGEDVKLSHTRDILASSKRKTQQGPTLNINQNNNRKIIYPKSKPRTPHTNSNQPNS